MSRADIPAVEQIIADTINETARGDPDGLSARIVAALAVGGYRIVPANGMEDTALGSQPFDELTPEMRPQDNHGDGRDWRFETSEHGGDEPDYNAANDQGDRCGRALGDLRAPGRGGKIVVPRPRSAT